MPTAHFRSSNRARNSKPIDRLRLAIECLPRETREAMLDGVLCSPRVIAGAYTDGEGGVCPMLAAHRRGARTSFLSFARSWDRFTRAPRSARRVTARELSILVGMLRASLMDEEHVDLARAIAEHSELLACRERLRVVEATGEIVARRLSAARRLACRRRERAVA